MQATLAEAPVSYQRVEILLVEDTDTDAEMTVRALRRGGYADHLVWVRDGSEALEFLFGTGSRAGIATTRPRIIMLDIKMPRVDGFEVLRQIMTDPGLRTVPVLMLTSSAEARDIEQSYELGANSYIVKPVDAAEYRRVIAEVGRYWIETNRTPDGPSL